MFDDEQLTFYFYEDGLDEATRASIGAALDADPVLARRYAALRTDLLALARPCEPVPTTGALDERLHSALIEAASETAPTRTKLIPFALAASVALVAVLVALLTHTPIDETPSMVATPSAPIEQTSRSLRLVQTHLVQSRLQLVRYTRVEQPERRALVDELIAQNRAIEASAERAGDEDLARVLRAFGPVLERLANPTADARSTQQLLEQLNFELNAMLTKLDAPASDTALSF